MQTLRSNGLLEIATEIFGEISVDAQPPPMTLLEMMGINGKLCAGEKDSNASKLETVLDYWKQKKRIPVAKINRVTEKVAYQIFRVLESMTSLVAEYLRLGGIPNAAALNDRIKVNGQAIWTGLSHLLVKLTRDSAKDNVLQLYQHAHLLQGLEKTGDISKGISFVPGLENFSCEPSGSEADIAQRLMGLLKNERDRGQPTMGAFIFRLFNPLRIAYPKEFHLVECLMVLHSLKSFVEVMKHRFVPAEVSCYLWFVTVFLPSFDVVVSTIFIHSESVIQGMDAATRGSLGVLDDTAADTVAATSAPSDSSLSAMMADVPTQLRKSMTSLAVQSSDCDERTFRPRFMYLMARVQKTNGVAVLPDIPSNWKRTLTFIDSMLTYYEGTVLHGLLTDLKTVPTPARLRMPTSMTACTLSNPTFQMEGGFALQVMVTSASDLEQVTLPTGAALLCTSIESDLKATYFIGPPVTDATAVGQPSPLHKPRDFPTPHFHGGQQNEEATSTDDASTLGTTDEAGGPKKRKNKRKDKGKGKKPKGSSTTPGPGDTPRKPSALPTGAAAETAPNQKGSPPTASVPGSRSTAASPTASVDLSVSTDTEPKDIGRAPKLPEGETDYDIRIAYQQAKRMWSDAQAKLNRDVPVISNRLTAMEATVISSTFMIPYMAVSSGFTTILRADEVEQLATQQIAFVKSNPERNMIKKLEGKPESEWRTIITEATTKRNAGIARRIEQVDENLSLENVDKMPLLCVTDLVYHMTGGAVQPCGGSISGDKDAPVPCTACHMFQFTMPPPKPRVTPGAQLESEDIIRKAPTLADSNVRLPLYKIRPGWSIPSSGLCISPERVSEFLSILCPRGAKEKAISMDTRSAGRLAKITPGMVADHLQARALEMDTMRQ